jgi:hypothetical protein
MRQPFLEISPQTGAGVGVGSRWVLKGLWNPWYHQYLLSLLGGIRETSIRFSKQALCKQQVASKQFTLNRTSNTQHTGTPPRATTLPPTVVPGGNQKAGQSHEKTAGLRTKEGRKSEHTLLCPEWLWSGFQDSSR